MLLEKFRNALLEPIFQKISNLCVNLLRFLTKSTIVWEIFDENSIEKYLSIFGKGF